MSKLFMSLVAVLVLGGGVVAQSVEQGRKFLYYERYKSARETFEKVLAANPNNIDAVYWLGQTLLEQKDSVAAKGVYQKLLSQNGNAPLVLAGIGQIELMEGKTNDARQHFETAISLSKGKDVEVLNAVGRANVDARSGDANYAIEKLNLATQTKNFKDPETYLIMGDAYRKLVDGGNAVTSYTKAFQLDAKLAAAKYRIGRIYLTQGNKEYFLPAFEEAVQIDPAYAPAYYQLFYYWYFRDVNKAAPYLESYITNSDTGPEAEYIRTDFLFASGKFAEAKTKALGLISQVGDKVAPRMYKLVAYACDTLKDIACANKYMTDYFAKQAPEEVVPADYEELANINAQTPGSEAQAFVNLQKAVEKDTLPENKVKYINKAAELAKKMGDRNQQANWLGIAYQTKATPNQNDIYNWGYTHYLAGNYATSDSIFTIYEQKYPTEIYGPLWRAKSNLALEDSANPKGLAVPHYQKFIEVAKASDSVKYKSQIVGALFYLAGFSNDVRKDKDSAIYYLTQITYVDPTNEQAKKFIEVLSKPPARSTQPQQRRTGGTSATDAKPAAKTGTTAASKK
jgi:tetratricopeptide (TPR) repeat protein